MDLKTSDIDKRKSRLWMSLFSLRPLRRHQPASGWENNRYQGDQRQQRTEPRLERSIPV